jgi:hypothetical protein
LPSEGVFAVFWLDLHLVFVGAFLALCFNGENGGVLPLSVALPAVVIRGHAFWGSEGTQGLLAFIVGDIARLLVEWRSRLRVGVVGGSGRHLL